MAEYLARVSWDNILEYRKIMKKDDEASKDTYRLTLTDQYGSDQPILDKLKYDDRLWLFTAPEFGKGRNKHILPPSVMGRIKIRNKWNINDHQMRLADEAPKDAVLKSDPVKFDICNYKYWRSGEPGIVLPINNAFSLFKSLTFRGRVKQVNPACKRCNPSNVPRNGPFGHLMEHFESIRLLTDDSVARLNKLQDHVVSRRTLFMSHRHGESVSIVSEVARQLDEAALCWWDVNEIPQTAYYEDPILRNMLEDGIRQAGWFVAFLTPGYSMTKWTDDEWKNALAFSSDPDLKHRPRILPILLGGKLPGGIKVEKPVNVGSNPRAIAQEILKRIESVEHDPSRED